jgi:hypothetical protein
MALTIDHLVNRQILKWQAERQAAEQGALEAGRHHPMITVTREYGARGAEIGSLAAERLGFHFYSQELVEQIAQEAHVRRQVIESVDERTQDAIDNVLGELFGGEYFAPSEYLRNLSKVVLTLGRHGKGVIVGRGAQFILHPDHTLRVRAFAPIEVRVQRIAGQRGLSADDARAEVLRVDAERAAFYKRHFGRDVRDPAHYDLLFNTGSLPVQACADIVALAFRKRFAAAP